MSETGINPAPGKAEASNRRPLDWLNFFLADVKDGVGPFLAIFLLSSAHWDPRQIGVALTVAGVTTVLARGPAGALVDAVRWKRALIAAGAVVVAIAAASMALLPRFWPVALAQVGSGAADAVFPIGDRGRSVSVVVGRRAFTHRVRAKRSFQSRRERRDCDPRGCRRLLHPSLGHALDRGCARARKHRGGVGHRQSCDRPSTGARCG